MRLQVRNLCIISGFVLYPHIEKVCECGGEKRKENEREKRGKTGRRLQGMGIMCQIVDDLGHVFDAWLGKEFSDSRKVGVMCENGDNGDGVSNGGRWYEITVK